jgi:hypothetical protein
MKDNLVASKTGIAYIKDQAGNWYFYGLTDSTGITQTSNTELLTSSPSAHTITKLFYNKQMTVDIMPTLFNTRFEAMQNSALSDVSTVTTDITTHEQLVAVDNTGTIEVTLTGTPVLDSVKVVDIYNESFASTYATGTVAITDGVAGDTYIVMYEEEQIDVEQIDFARDSFPENVEVSIMVLASDSETNIPAEKWYYNFPICSPSGEFDLSFEKESSSMVGVTFDVLTGLTGLSYGSKTVIPVV